MGTSISSLAIGREGGESLWVVEDITTIKLGGELTGGTFALMEVAVSPGKGTPPHFHERETETFYVTRGTVRFWMDGETIDASAGTTVHAPKLVPHFFTNVTDEPASMLCMAVPAGMDDFFRTIGDPVSDPNGPPAPVDVPRLEAGCAAFGIRLLPPA